MTTKQIYSIRIETTLVLTMGAVLELRMYIGDDYIILPAKVRDSFLITMQRKLQACQTFESRKNSLNEGST